MIVESIDSDIFAISGERRHPAPLAGGGLIVDSQAAALAQTFQALADTTRLKLISSILRSEMRVVDLAAALAMTQSAVSHQLRLLRDLHIVKGRRQGREVFYSLDDDHVRDLFIFGLKHVQHV